MSPSKRDIKRGMLQQNRSSVSLSSPQKESHTESKEDLSPMKRSSRFQRYSGTPVRSMGLNLQSPIKVQDSQVKHPTAFSTPKQQKS